MDTPYRVERSVRVVDNGRSRVVSYTIVRSGEGDLVYGDSATLMYKIVDLLNDEEHSVESR